MVVVEKELGRSIRKNRVECGHETLQHLDA